MDNYKKLSEELLKKDGIDPTNITETERAMFSQMLDKETKHLKRLTSWRSDIFFIIFILAMYGIFKFKQIFSMLHIPLIAAWPILITFSYGMLFLLWPRHLQQILKSSRKVQSLDFTVHGKYKGFFIVGKKNGKRYIDWLNIILLLTVVWLLMVLGGSAFYRKLYGYSISYSTSNSILQIIVITITSLPFIISCFYFVLKTPLEKLTEISKENGNRSRRKFSLINLVIILTVTLLIIYLFIPSQKSNETDNHSSIPSLGLLTLAQQIARAPLIVRAVLEDCNETGTRWRITKVLHGKITDDFVDVSYFPVSTEPEKSPESMQSWWHRIEESKGKTLNTEEIWKEFSKIHSFWPTLGKEVILFLEKQNDKLYRYQGANYDVPPEHSLDKQEKLIKQAIDSGAYKTAPPEDGRL